ncbi:MAG: efflux RND transporter periplasmic adaptor subunit [Planctomycetes bacterium]|nr:efflux RND transporter periplasmic adaptor subunit [Planctomycetota bacterium]
MIILLLGVAIGAGVYVWFLHAGDFLRPEVKTAVAEVRVPGMSDSVLRAQGYLKSRRQAAIGAKVPGRILKLYVEEGQRVEEGDVLAELEHADTDASLEAMRASLEAMRATVDRTKAELAEIESDLEQDERDYARADQLFRSKSVSGAEFERAQSKLTATRSRRTSLRAAVTLSEARLREADARMRETQEMRENMFVRAPFTGTVISKEAELGESIMPGGMGTASGRGAVVTLADLDHLEVETDVKEDYVSRTWPGQSASIAVDKVPDRRYKGRVRTIIPMGDRARGTVKVKVEILDVDERLFPEIAATVHFLSDRGVEAQSGPATPQVFAPAEAVKTDDQETYVWQVVSGRVHRVSVETGDSQEGRVLILRGLKGGEQLVLNPSDSLKEDAPVKVAP